MHASSEFAHSLRACVRMLNLEKVESGESAPSLQVNEFFLIQSYILALLIKHFLDATPGLLSRLLLVQAS